jgi:hypothetical protein
MLGSDAEAVRSAESRALQSAERRLLRAMADARRRSSPAGAGASAAALQLGSPPAVARDATRSAVTDSCAAEAAHVAYEDLDKEEKLLVRLAP